MRLFDISTEYQALYELAETIDYDENGNIIDNSIQLAELFGDIELELKDKFVNTQYIIKELEVSEKALKDEAKRLTEKAKVIQNRQKRLKDLIKTVMIAAGEAKIKTDKFSFSTRIQEVYNYDDVNLEFVDSEFVKVKKELNKNQVKQFIKAGGVVEGVKISEDTVLTVR